MQERRIHWLARHLDGWPAGALVLLLVGSTFLLAVPRAVPPEELPAPELDIAALASLMVTDDARARAAEAEPLDLTVRQLGSALRRYNAAAAGADQDALLRARREVTQAVLEARAQDPEALLRLRAYQMRQFLAALRRWQESGVPDAELDELGGDALHAFQRNQWCVAGSRALLPDEGVLRVLYKKRWNDVTGLVAPPFALAGDEERLRHGFFLQHPFRPARHAPKSEGERALERTALSEQRLESIDRLSEIDASYPADVARGVVLYQMGRFGPAAEAFRRHLDEHRDGPYALRARNHMLAALEQESALR